MSERLEPLRFLRIDVTAKDGYAPPFFAGSMLRGAMGAALKHVVCINPSLRCQGCFAAKDCLFYDWFENQNAYHTYRITARLGMRRLRFSLWLYEDAIRSLPYTLSAIRFAMEKKGLGREEKRVPIERIDIGKKRIYEADEFKSLENIEPQHYLPENLPDRWRLKWHTPLRIKADNRFVRNGNGVKLDQLVRSAYRRYHEIKGIQNPKIDFYPKGEMEGNWRYLDLTRYSNRQRTHMKLGGMMGEITLKNLDKRSSFYLQMGQMLGLGKQTVFGLGDYMLTLEKE